MPKEEKIICGDSLEVLKDFEDNYFDSVVTDPPYGLAFMGKKWDYDVPEVELWKEVYRVLKPGGHLLSFAGSRTYHRMAVNIEDAGFEIRDMLGWLYGSGFPKSYNIGKAIDKKPEVLNTKKFKNWLENQINDCKKTKKQINDECGFVATSYTKTDGKDYWSTSFPSLKKWKIMKKVIGINDEYDFIIRNNINKRGFVDATGNLHKGSGNNIKFSGKQLSDNPIEETAKQWEGWGTALKPAHEPIVMARKPFNTSVAENVLTHGTGGINIDECRVEIILDNEDRAKSKNTIQKTSGISFKGNKKDSQETPLYNLEQGRFPANIIHDGSEEVLEVFPETTSGKMSSKHTRHTDESPHGIYGKFDINHPLGETYGDTGSAARFFYCAKASKAERNMGLDDFPDKVNKITNMYEMERNDGTIRELAHKKNYHPTVKPIKLMEYLVKLVTPKEGIVLEPFAGSGTTLIACKQQGFNYIGIEREQEYCDIAKARLKSVQIQGTLF